MMPRPDIKSWPGEAEEKGVRTTRKNKERYLSRYKELGEGETGCSSRPTYIEPNFVLEKFHQKMTASK